MTSKLDRLLELIFDNYDKPTDSYIDKHEEIHSLKAEIESQLEKGEKWNKAVQQRELDNDEIKELEAQVKEYKEMEKAYKELHEMIIHKDSEIKDLKDSKKIYLNKYIESEKNVQDEVLFGMKMVEKNAKLKDTIETLRGLVGSKYISYEDWQKLKAILDKEDKK